MALSTTPIQFALGAATVPGTSVAPSLAVPDNCHTIVLVNVSAANTGLFGIATPPASLVDGTNAAQLPPLGSVTLAAGPYAQRGPLDQAQVAGSGLAFDCIGGAARFNVIYLCGLGSPE